MITYYVQSTNPAHPLNVPFSIVLIHYLLCSFVLINFRVLIKLLYYQLTQGSDKKTNIIIYGAGNLGLITKSTLLQSGARNDKVLGFIDEHEPKQGKHIGGLKVYSPDQVLNHYFVKKENLHAVILAISDISASRKRELADQCIELGVELKVVPPVENWIDGHLSPQSINNIKIEDLLGRDCIELDMQNIKNGIKDQTVFISGGAGSIGSEIVRQTLMFQPRQVIIYDQAETAMHDLKLELLGCEKVSYNDSRMKFIIGDVTNKPKIEKLFQKFKPSLVFHAAAYKHVPMMEDNPYEAVRVNVKGTKTVAEVAIKYKAKRFVVISTDKAVNPTNIMGATKRIAEMYTRSLHNIHSSTRFIITRFGNVLGSNGSVIPLFKKQIEEGGPVTVTHPDITRYFMTIPEACQLVMEAAFMGREGEIYVFDMGESVRIYDLAKKMIQLSGLRLDKDIEIKISGLRSGEKLHEELLATRENTKPTHNPKILIGAIMDYDFKKLVTEVNTLCNQLDELEGVQIVQAIKRIVPEYVSDNSFYKELDL